ncbi:unnamed protein product [Hymenolepis diminuta]|uniref:Uncharacterized protein n=1 Tax=Hymenolepis diminuta TaxID=6216 RepID=A0A564Y970_HYMDI|nr:unnamed protein product [Hymenolepis diminuta]
MKFQSSNQEFCIASIAVNIWGVRQQRPHQPIINQYPCSLALFVHKDQGRGQRLTRSSVRLKFIHPIAYGSINPLHSTPFLFALLLASL